MVIVQSSLSTAGPKILIGDKGAGTPPIFAASSISLQLLSLYLRAHHGSGILHDSVKRNKQMALRRASTYTIEQLTDLEEQAAAAATEHLFEAADWLTDLFVRYDIPHAFMGGFAMQLRGSRRVTQDLDVAVGCTMLRLLNVLREQQGVLLPSGLASGVLRIFIEIKTSSQLDQIYVHADLILEGGLGVPRSMDNETEMLTVRTPSGDERCFRVLNLRRQTIAKLRAADTRRLASDFDDILFLATTYPIEVAAFRNELDRDHCQVFINELYSRGLNAQMLAGVERTIGVTGFREEE